MGKMKKNLSKKKKIKKILSTSTAGLVLLSSLANPLVTLATTTEEKTTQETVPSSTENKQLPTENNDLLQKTITSSENEHTQTEADDTTEQTINSSDEKMKQQAELKSSDHAREAQGTSEIELRTPEKTFMRVTFSNGKITFAVNNGKPQEGNFGILASLRLSNNGVTKYIEHIYGDTIYKDRIFTYNVQEGDMLQITKKESTELVNHPTLIPIQRNNEYTYVVTGGKLLETSQVAENAVKELYEDEEQTIVKPTLLQTDIDSAREKVNVLPDGEGKAALLSKVDQAFNGLQEIQLKGYNDRLFSRMTVTNGKLVVRTEEGRPHSYFEENYAEITVRRGEQNIYSLGYYGNEVYPNETAEVNLQNGDIVTVMKKEANDTRFVVNHPELKPNTDGNYTYVVQDGLLIEASRKIQLDAQNAVKGLYEDEEQTIVKKTLLQTDIDDAREKVSALPDGEEKTALLEKVDQAFNGLQEIQLKGWNHHLFSRITVTKGKLVIQTEEGKPHHYFENNYATIHVTRGETNVFSKEYNGNISYPANTDELDLQDGDIISITKQEADAYRYVVNHTELKPNTDGNYTYVVRDGLLVDQTVVYRNAKMAVDQLFDGEEPKETNTQEQINDAREKINALLDSNLKQQLLAKLDQAQEKLDSVTGALTVEEYRLAGTDAYVRGTVTGNVAYLRLEVNGTLYAKSTVKDSTFAYYALDKIKKSNDQVYIVAYNPEDKEIARQAVPVIGAQGELTVQPYVLNGTDRYIRGTYSGEIDHIRLRVNGKLYAKSTVSGNSFQYYAVDKLNNVTDKVELVGYDRLGNIVTEETVVIEEIATTLSVDKYVLGGSDRYIRGTYTGNISYLRLEVNGTLYSKAGVKGSPFQYYAVDKIKNINDQVSLVAYDDNDQELTRQTVTLEQQTTGTVTPETYILGEGDRYIRGTYTGDVDHLRLEVNGKLYAKSTVTGGVFQYYAVDKITQSTDVVNIIAYDINGIELAKEKVTIQETAPATLNTEKFIIGGTDKYVRGTYQGDVDHFRLEVNGELYAKSTAKGSPFQYYAFDKITNKNDQVNIIAYDANGKELAKEKVTLETVNQGNLTAEPYVINGGDNYLRGSYTGDIDHLRLEVNGKLYAKSTVKSSPFRYYAVDKIKNVSDEVYIIGYDSAGVELDKQLVEVSEK